MMKIPPKSVFILVYCCLHTLYCRTPHYRDKHLSGDKRFSGDSSPSRHGDQNPSFSHFMHLVLFFAWSRLHLFLQRDHTSSIKSCVRDYCLFLFDMQAQLNAAIVAQIDSKYDSFLCPRVTDNDLNSNCWPPLDIETSSAHCRGCECPRL